MRLLTRMANEKIPAAGAAPAAGDASAGGAPGGRAPDRGGGEPPAAAFGEARRGAGGLEGLTPREVEVLRLLSRGQTNPQIARNLMISRGTAKIHVQHIISKLGVSDRTQAAVRAIEAGLLGAGTQR